MGALPGLRAATTKRVIDAVVAGMHTGTGGGEVKAKTWGVGRKDSRGNDDFIQQEVFSDQ